MEFALHPLLCAPNAHFRAAHQGGVDDALLVASELITDALTHSAPEASCELTCSLGQYEVTISVTGPYDTATRSHLPSSPLGLPTGAGKLYGLRQRIVHKIADHVRIARRPGGGRTTTATIPLTGP
ncbi:ATP-binding protein [Streptomyces anulatus]